MTFAIFVFVLPFFLFADTQQYAGVEGSILDDIFLHVVNIKWSSVTFSLCIFEEMLYSYVYDMEYSGCKEVVLTKEFAVFLDVGLIINKLGDDETLVSKSNTEYVNTMV